MSAPTSSRLVSLDVFRGLTVALMLLVNHPGDWGHIYTPLAHAEWHGCTLADLVFPFFLFIVGVSIAFALRKTSTLPPPYPPTLLKIWRRAAVLAGLGLFASTWLDFDPGTLRIPGVLVRIALVYGLSATIFLLTSWRTQAALVVGLLVGYAVLLQVVPVPGVGPANLEPATNLGASLGRDGHLPAWLAKGAEPGAVPRRAMAAWTVIALVYYAAMVATGLHLEPFILIHTSSMVAVYALGMIAAVRLLARWSLGWWMAVVSVVLVAGLLVLAGVHLLVPAALAVVAVAVTVVKRIRHT